MITKLCAARGEAGSTAARSKVPDAISRRSSLVMLGGVFLVIALPVTAQLAGKMRRIAWFGNRPTVPDTAFLGDAFREGLKERGYVEGVNVTIEYRYGEGNVARYPALAAELAALGADVVVITAGPPAVCSMQAANASTPIVLVGIGDPVGQRLWF